MDGYDIFSEAYEQSQFDMWKSMREQGCPVAHTEAWGGAWMLASYDDMQMVLNDPEHYSSRAVEIAGTVPAVGSGLVMPPVTSDPPAHGPQRDLLAPFFTAAKIQSLEPFVRDIACGLIGRIAGRGHGEVMGDLARPYTLSVLTHLLGVPEADQARFEDWATRIMRLGPTDEAARAEAIGEVWRALTELLEQRTREPGDDVISHIAHARLEGQPISRKHQIGSLMLLVMAGADTTWNTLGASLWHLARHPEDRRRLIAEPTLLKTTAVEELLRVFAPVTLARITTTDVSLHGRCPVAHERVLLPLAAANRDPSVFDKPDDVQLDRKRNRHMTFGTGVHRCLGAPLARLEMRVALEEWLRVMPDFELANDDPIRWTWGQVRGPEEVHVRVTTGAA